MAAMDGEAKLGYVFHAFHSGASLGYAALDVFLAAAGLDDGFATAQLILPIWDSDDSSSRVTLTEQWSGGGELHVAPGIVTIRSYGGGEQSAYCFGGSFTCVQSQPGRLHGKLTSPAPILNLGEEGMDWAENVVLRVVDGIESELAAARADGHLHSAVAFHARLAHTDPRLLYAVGLVKAQHSFAMLPDILRTENYWVEHNTLTHALHEAQDSGWWPSEATLSAVLGQA